MARSAQLVLAIVCIVGVARGDDAVTAADRAFKDGRRAAEHGDYASACRYFDESYRLDPAVGTLINLGDCAEHLLDIERAYQYYRTASQRLGDGDDRMPRVRARLENIDQRSAKVALRLDPGAPKDTVVTLDGATIDPQKTPLHLSAGSHVVIATAVGHRGTRYAVAVNGGEIRAVDVSPGPQLEEVLPTSAQGEGSAGARNAWAKPAAVVSLGVGLGTVWMASLAGLAAIDKRDVQNANCGPGGCNQTGVDAAHDGATWAAVSTATFIAGGVLIGAGAVFLAVVLTSKRAAAKAALHVGPFGVTLAGSF